MAMSSYEAYISSLAQSPNDFYRDNVQASVTDKFLNTTRLDTIYEEDIDFDFDFVNQHEVIVDSVSDTYTNYNKVLGDYKSIIYEDCRHEVIRGQYILYDNDYYLVYEGTSKLATSARSKVIRCTNKIKWYDKNNDIVEYPVVISQEVGSTNPQVAKDGITPNARLVVMLQCNEHTQYIKINQRFVISHKQVFKINEINMYDMEDIENEKITMMKLYFEWVSANEYDDLENNISHVEFDDESSEGVPEGDKIVLSPAFDMVMAFCDETFTAMLYSDGELTNEDVTCVASGADSSSYQLTETINKNEFNISCLSPSSVPLTLTFTSGIVERVVSIELVQFM